MFNISHSRVVQFIAQSSVFVLLQMAHGSMLQVPSQYATIQQAIDASASGDEVVIADGVYTGAGNKDLDFRGKAITVRSVSRDPAACVIDCQGNGRGFYFHRAETDTSIIEALTIRGGDANTADLGNGQGGGVLCANTSPTLTRCIITRNRAGDGAGVYCTRSYVNLIDCTISQNGESPDGPWGAGLYCADNSAPLLNRCRIIGNHADFGGGMYCVDSSPALTRCAIDDNNSDYEGGGMICAGLAYPLFIRCSIDRNIADVDGGGLLSWSCNPTLLNCTLNRNYTSDRGGGMSCSGGVPELTNCTINGNYAGEEGGGVYCGGSNPRLINCTILENRADHYSGAVFSGGDSNPVLTNCTVVGNTVINPYDQGDSIGCFDTGQVTLTNCILWGNAPLEIACGGSVTYCDVQGGRNGTGNRNADPRFMDRDGPDNDPSTWEDNDYRPSAGSPCIDAGDNDAVIFAFDLQEQARFVDDPSTPDSGQGTAPIVDLGAYEYQGVPLRGDVNCDSFLSLDDVDALVLLLTDPAKYRVQYAGCDASRGDMNNDASQDGRDIEPFIAALLP